VIATNAKNDTPEYSAWLNGFKNEGSQNFIPSQNLKIALDKNLQGTILWPVDGNYSQNQPSDLNETSIVFRLEYGQFCALLTGDIGKDSQDIIALANPQQECHLLKVPHHGSKNNISEALWRQIMPKIAVIQAGKNNRFGHPHNEAIDSLSKLGSRILRNDQEGTTEIVTDGKIIQIKNKN
jgi:competence protein ComEC